MIYADHSGPSFWFDGKVSPRFESDLIAWLEGVLKEADWQPPHDIIVQKDGAVEIEYVLSGEPEDEVTIRREPDGNLAVRISGDCQQISPPADEIIREGTYTDGEGDVYVVFEGKEYDLSYFLKLLEKEKGNENTKAGSNI